MVNIEGEKKQIGSLVGCVYIFDPVLDKLYRNDALSDEIVTYESVFDGAEIERFNLDRISGVYKNGGFSKELLSKNPPKLMR